MPLKNDLTGKRFGKLTVIAYAGKSKKREYLWHCKCDCGKETISRGYHLMSGHCKSCGCTRGRTHKTHGLSNHQLYHTWSSMKQRCTNPKVPEFNAYGGRGIKVCDEWTHDFKAFYDWAMANGYDPKLSIDRIDNDKGYSPDNCRWATMEQQIANRRYVKPYTYTAKDGKHHD